MPLKFFTGANLLVEFPEQLQLDGGHLKVASNERFENPENRIKVIINP